MAGFIKRFSRVRESCQRGKLVTLERHEHLQAPSLFNCIETCHYYWLLILLPRSIQPPLFGFDAAKASELAHYYRRSSQQSREVFHAAASLHYIALEGDARAADISADKMR